MCGMVAKLLLRLPTTNPKISFPQITKIKAKSIKSAVEDTFYLTKDTYERHKVVCTIGASIASVAAAWAGYTLRHLHNTKVERRLDLIENTMKNNYHIEHNEFKKLVRPSSSFIAAHVATAGASLIIGYGLGWRGGLWSANRRIRKEQMKLLGQKKLRRWPLRFLRRPWTKPKTPDVAVKTSEILTKNVPDAHTTSKAHSVC